jgi:hypothetical protein
MLLAAGEWLNFILPLVFLLYAVIQLLASKGAATKAGPQPRRPPRPPEPAERALGQPQGAKPAPTGQSQLNAEIEQFLKRAGERRERGRREAIPTVKAPPKAAPRPVAQPAVETRKPISAGLSSRRDADPVSASVEKHLANRGFAERAEHLADEVVRAEGQFEEHVKKTFTRKVGTLDQATPAAPSTPVTDVAPSIDVPSPAVSVAALLANPQNVRQVLVLSEILVRPEHRW